MRLLARTQVDGMPYEDWLKILMALDAELGTRTALEVAYWWQPEEYHAELPGKFNSFHRKKGKIVTWGTLEFLARKYRIVPRLVTTKGGNFEKQFIDAADLWPFIEKHRVVFVKSPHGSGKTRTLVQIANDPRYYGFMDLGHRRALLRSKAKDLNTAVYLDIEGDKRRNEPRLSLCANSTPSLVTIDESTGLPTGVPKYALLSLDEYSQFLSHISADSYDGNRVVTLAVLRELVRQADTVLVMDAGLSQEDIDASVRDWNLQPGEYCVIENTVENPGLKAKLYGTEWALTSEMLDRIALGEKAFVVTNNRGRASRLMDLITDRFPKLRCLFIHADNSQSAEVQALMTDTSGFGSYDVVVSTPAIGTGISIDKPMGFVVYGFGDSYVTPAPDFMQQLRRMRSPKDSTLHLWLDQACGGNFIRSAGEAKLYMYRRHHLLGLRHNEAFTDFIEADRKYIELTAHVVQRNSEDTVQFRYQMLNILHDLGIVVEELPEDIDDEALIEEVKDIAKRQKENWREMVLTAPEVDEDDLEWLRRKASRTPEEAATLQKGIILDRYGEFTEELFDLEQKGLWSKIQERRLLLEDPEAVSYTHLTLPTNREV